MSFNGSGNILDLGQETESNVNTSETKWVALKTVYSCNLNWYILFR